ncbi:hypothetical protein UR09_06265 [Candidatus Nitromaritima sp. SCGC AAA799-A02]|nr:hypothetical protein UR09_06265 [Candidatus Nitromaritima sp. SCGC AAA799-A02]
MPLRKWVKPNYIEDVMVDPVQGLNKLITSDPLRKSTQKPVIEGSLVSALEGVDSVDFNSDALIEAVRQQAAVLKNELPSIIAEAVIAPISDQVVRDQPLNSILFRLQNPLEGVLGKLPQEELTEDLVQKLQEELNKFKIGLPSLKDEAILAQFSGSAQAGPLDAIISSLSNQVDGLSFKLDQLL